MKESNIKIRLRKTEHKQLTEIKNNLNYDYNVRVSYQSLTELAIHRLLKDYSAGYLSINHIVDHTTKRNQNRINGA